MFADVFKKELRKIKNPEFKKAVIEIGEGTPDYIYEIPSSSTGKYHPADEISDSGQIMHVRRVFVCAEESARLAQLTRDEQEILYAGALLHDMFKNGEKKDKYTIKQHPILAYKHILSWLDGKEVSDELKLKIRKLAFICLLHEGQWTIPESIALSEKDFTVEELVEFRALENAMHWADYWASRRTVSDAMQKDAVEGVQKQDGSVV